ncbi:Dehydrogenase, multihelical [Penicillium italicum]|uniref:Dehydrogenase, multihelical n=1 Tax=Penicillium italicum TaxID=40296 RepID=A0A0A2L6J1_PENIT|nr:Dehydrogenase, multihelical [Penicillium italicum]
MASNEQIVGWIGLGSMGLAMAQNVQRYLQQDTQSKLRFWNRTVSRGAPLALLGAIGCESIAKLVAECDLVFISTSDDAALNAIVDQILTVQDIDSKLFVDTTTVHPNTTKETDKKLKKRNASFVAAPVFGATPAAESGTVLMAMAGPSEAIDIIAPFGKGVIARDVMIVSDQPEKATLLKTLGNFLVAGTMEIVGEAQVLAEKSDLGTGMLEKLLELNFGGLMHSSSRRMTQGVYLPEQGQSPWSNLNLGIKDVQHGISCAQDVGARLKVAEVALENMSRAKEFSDAHGGRPLDSSAGYGIIRQDSGLDFENAIVKERDTRKEDGSS